ncbi:MAG: DUF4215 domain-containing protein [Myxococcota bacterium]
MRPLVALALALPFAFGIFAPRTVEAFGSYRTRVPNGQVNSCLTCHNNPSGGNGCGGATSFPTSNIVSGDPDGFCLNHFGADFRAAGRMWTEALGDMDSDCDGRTNAQELLYFGVSYTFAVDEASAGPDAEVTLPGWGPYDPPPPTGSEYNHNECATEALALGSGATPDNYTNCAPGPGGLCTNGAASDMITPTSPPWDESMMAGFLCNALPGPSVPMNSRYYGFTCSCATGYAGNGRVDITGDGVADAGADGCNPVCGDGMVVGGEPCDDGAMNSDTIANACRTNCMNPSCGDGVVDTGEVCDDGAMNSDTIANACRTNCMNPSCGDGVVDMGEMCDDGAMNGMPGSSCDMMCQTVMMDASVDASLDATVDASVDASLDATVDANVDASLDAAVDSSTDAMLPDADGPDADAEDAATDARPEAALPDGTLPTAPVVEDSGCTAGGSLSGGSSLWLGLLALVALRRRRR